MKNIELLKMLLKDTEEVVDGLGVPNFGTWANTRKEIFRALLKITLDRGVKR